MELLLFISAVPLLVSFNEIISTMTFNGTKKFITSSTEDVKEKKILKVYIRMLPAFRDNVPSKWWNDKDNSTDFYIIFPGFADDSSLPSE